jgi:hypothetical protein
MALPPVQVQKKRGLGCVGCGCSVFAAIVILLVALVAASSYYFYKAALSYTGTAAVPVPQFDGGDQVFNTAGQKIIAFEQALQGGQPASLHLNADEINTLIARDPSFAKLRGQLFVTLNNDEATVQTSLLLSNVESVVLTDRYLNGTATFALYFDPADKSIHIDLHRAHLQDRDLPGTFTDGFNKSAGPMLNQKLQADPAARDFINSLQKMTVENGELVIETH